MYSKPDLTRVLLAALETIPIAIVVADRSGAIVYVNRAFETLTGYAAEEVLGRTPSILKSGRQPDEFYQELWSTIKTGRVWNAEVVNRRKDGTEFPARHIIVPVSDETGTITHYIGFQEDLTALRQAQAQFQQAQRLENVDKLFGGVAHDFNNLLHVIMGNSEFLIERLSGNDELLGFVEAVMSAAERGSDLTRQLLAFSRQQPLDSKPTDINVLVGGMNALIDRTLGDDIEIEMVRAAGLWSANIDAGQLENALLNLCINARDAMPDGGKLTIETANAHLDQEYADGHREVRPGQYVMVAVSDTGTGMPSVVAERVFEPYFTTKEIGEGHGLGLSMVYGFTKQSGGHVKIYSEPGTGTVVKLYLPRAQGKGRSQEIVPSARAITGGTERILLVEDNHLVRNHVAAQLEALGYQVTTVGNGPEALERLRRSQPIDLLLTDLVVPGGMTGRRLADEARKLRPGMAILLTSGYPSQALIQNGTLKQGMPLLQKPYRRHDLARRVRQTLNSRRNQGGETTDE